MMWSDCEMKKRSVTSKKLAQVAILDYRRVTVVVISHQTSRKICTVVTWRRARGRHAMPHSHQYSSAFLTSSSRHGAWSSSPGLLHHHLQRRGRLRCLSCGILRSVVVLLSSRTDIPAKTFLSRVFWINWICANRFPLFLLVPLHLQTLISSLIHTRTRTHLHNHTHTPSHWIRNILHIHKSSMKNHNSPLPNY